MRLSPNFRFALFAVFAILFATGAVWIAADRMKDSADGELWQATAANLLMVHGGAAMAALLLLGALAPLHVQRGWRSRRNRTTGVCMLTLNGVLIATAFSLYYAGSEMLRPWISDIHIAFGLALPVLLVIHIVAGRRL